VAENTSTLRQEVVVKDIDMPFWSMVFFMVRWAIAAIPALSILFFLGLLVAFVLGGVGDRTYTPTAPTTAPRCQLPDGRPC
jgi:hypothetical protein